MNSLFLVIAGLLLACANRVIFYRMRKGYFSLRPAGKGFSLIETNFGKFHLDHRNARMALASQWNRRTVSLNEIAALKFRHRDDFAWYEEASSGFDLSDLWPENRDRINWYTINLLMQDGVEVPVFTAGQYEPREFLAGWYFEFEAGILESLGLKPDVAKHARTVLNQFLEEFRKAGKPMPLQ